MAHAKHSENVRCIVETTSQSTVLLKIDKPFWQYEILERIKVVPEVANWSCLVIDLSAVQRATTAAFAQLLQVKRQLMKAGRRMSLQGIQEQPLELCRILKLTDLLLNGAGVELA